MRNVIKAGIVAGAAQIVVNVVLAIPTSMSCCLSLMYPFATAAVAGAAAGWWAMEWSGTEPNRSARNGAIAGALSAIGAFASFVLRVIGFIVLDQIPGFEDTIDIDIPPPAAGPPGNQNISLLPALAVVSLLVGIVVTFVLATVAGYWAARQHIATRAYPTEPGLTGIG